MLISTRIDLGISQLRTSAYPIWMTHIYIIPLTIWLMIIHLPNVLTSFEWHIPTTPYVWKHTLTHTYYITFALHILMMNQPTTHLFS